jgi:hypothetical protein
VRLSAEARAELTAVARRSSAGVATVRRAKILLMADQDHPEGGYADHEIAEAVGLCERQIVRIRQRFVKWGVQPVLTRAMRCDAGTRRVLDGRAEAQLVVLACSTPPAGRQSWTLQLLCDEMQRLQVVKSVCRETVRQTLKKINCGLGPASVSALPKATDRDSSRGWKPSSTSIRKTTTRSIR